MRRNKPTSVNLSRAARSFGFAAVTLPAVLSTGCRHTAQVAYQPPPPAIDQTASARPLPRSLPPRERSANELPSPDDVSGTPVFTQVGIASWYGPPYHHHAAADGSIFDQNAMTAAHRTLPMGSMLRVTNLATGQSVMVRVTDRGPFVPGRVLDLSLAAAKATGVWRPGTAKVRIEAFAHPTADVAGRWCVQIGAFRDREQALDVQAELMDRYKSAKVIEFAGPTGYWVRINPAQQDLASANEIAGSVRPPDQAAQPYVVRLN